MFMRIDPDDPNLTAYALDELEESAHSEIERALQKSTECREAVEEIKRAAALLVQQLGQEVCVGLSEDQRQPIADAAKLKELEAEAEHLDETVVRVPWSGLSWGWLPAGACVVLLLAFVVFLPHLTKSRAKAQRVPLAEPSETGTAIHQPSNGPRTIHSLTGREHPGAVPSSTAVVVSPMATKRNVRLPVPLTREFVSFAAADPGKPGDSDRFVIVGSKDEILGEARSDKLVVNLAGSAGQRFATARISVLGDHPQLIKRLNTSRERLLDVAAGALSSVTLEDVEKPGFRNLLRQQLLALFNDVLGRGTIQEVIITEFTVQ